MTHVAEVKLDFEDILSPGVQWLVHLKYFSREDVDKLKEYLKRSRVS